MMAAGLITIAHNSGGPKSDIVLPNEEKLPTGYLACSEEEYADAMYNTLCNGPNSEQNIAIRKRARISAQRFSDDVFNESFQELMLPHL